MRWRTVPLWQTPAELRAARHRTPSQDSTIFALSQFLPVYWVSNGRGELAGVTLAAPFPLTRGYERLFLPQFSSPCLPCDRASVRFCWQPSSLLLGRIFPRVQSYVVLPQAWASPYQCLHMLPPFGQDVASVAPFYGRLASLPLRQAVTTNRKDLKLSFTEGRNPFRFRGERNSGLAISSSDVLSGPGGHQG